MTEKNIIKPHKRLDVWNKAIDMTVDIYRLSDRFPKAEIYGLTSQMRRAAVSVPSNIAEGAARQTKKEFINYLHMAQGSLSELDTQLVIANRLKYISVEPQKRAHSPLLAAGLASESKNSKLPYGRRFPSACGGELQTFKKTESAIETISKMITGLIKSLKK